MHYRISNERKIVFLLLMLLPLFVFFALRKEVSASHSLEAGVGQYPQYVLDWFTNACTTTGNKAAQFTWVSVAGDPGAESAEIAPGDNLDLQYNVANYRCNSGTISDHVLNRFQAESGQYRIRGTAWEQITEFNVNPKLDVVLYPAHATGNAFVRDSWTFNVDTSTLPVGTDNVIVDVEVFAKALAWGRRPPYSNSNFLSCIVAPKESPVVVTSGGSIDDCPATKAIKTFLIEIKPPIAGDYNLEMPISSPQAGSQIERGSNITMSGYLCNVGDDIFHPSSSRPISVALRPPTNGTETFNYVSHNNVAGQDTKTSNTATYGSGVAYWAFNDVADSPPALSFTGGGCDTSVSLGEFQAVYTVPNNAPLGQYCSNVRFTPNRGQSGPPSTVTSTGGADPAGDLCFNVVNKPFYKVQGGDAWTGAVFASESGADPLTGACSLPVGFTAPASAGIGAGNRGHTGGGSLFTRDNYGASGQYGVFSLGNAGIISGNTIAPIGSYNIGLHFANTTTRQSPPFNSALTGSGVIGYFHSQDGGGNSSTLVEAPRCIEDYYVKAVAQGVDGTFGNNNFVLNNGNDGIQEHTGSGPLDVGMAGGFNSNTLIISGADIVIDSNLNGSGSTVAAGGVTIPRASVLTKGGDIYIDASVTNINADLIAIPDGAGNGGNIYTCASGTTPTFSIDVNTCENSLTISGQTIAKKIYLLRSGGQNNALHNAAGQSPANQVNYAAEVIDYRPEDFLINAILAGNSGVSGGGGAVSPTLPDVSTVIELPPIY